jgi:hypothetical protein
MHLSLVRNHGACSAIFLLRTSGRTEYRSTWANGSEVQGASNSMSATVCKTESDHALTDVERGFEEREVADRT